MRDHQITTRQAAEIAGIQPSTWSAYVARGQAPAASSRLDARTPLWSERAVKRWAAARKRGRNTARSTT